MTQAENNHNALPHVPVMLETMLAKLQPRNGETYVDATFGAGGYSTAILQAAPTARVIAFDRDPAARARYDALPDAVRQRCTFIDAPFSEMSAQLEKLNIEAVDGIVFDLGVSSPQLDEAARGFSFRFEGPLDMRMDPRRGQSAADLVNTASEQELADIIYEYGEDRKARAIARAIVKERAVEPLQTTGALAALVRRVVRANPRDASDPATRTFQALRIAVNRELEELQIALRAAVRWLKAGGRLIVVTFHSLEDRIVKQFFKTMSGGTGNPSRHLPDIETVQPLLTVKEKKALAPSAQDIRDNPRARSAHLRVALRSDSPFTAALESL